MGAEQVAPPFIIYALPRSRTYWLSRFLSTNGWHCGHDELRHARSLDDLRAWFSQPKTGTVESAAAPFWRLIQTLRPDIRTAVIRRPVAEVVESCMALNVGFDRTALTRNMTRLDAKLDQIVARVPGALSVPYWTLNDWAASGLMARDLAWHCTGERPPVRHWLDMDKRNLQTDMTAAIRYWIAYRPQLEKIAKIAKHRMLRDLFAAPCRETDGLTIQQEPFESFYRDAKLLMEDHCARIGETPDEYTTTNVPLARDLYARGVMQITTARCNGRIFGYLMTVYGPSLKIAGETEALNLAFFATGFPNLGMKLQRASAAALREKGIDRVFFRAGIVGDGPRLGTIARRMGGEEFGQMYKVELKAA